jgi:tetratricopeptide (TPR) repeat protein
VQRDRFDLAVTTGHAEVVDALDAFAVEVLSHGKGAAVILDAATLDAHAPLANAHAAALYLFLQTREGRQRAAPWLERARGAAARDGVGERERVWVEAIGAWAGGDVQAALAHHVGIARRWPGDLLNAKFAQIHQLSVGDRRGMRDLAAAVLPFHRGTSFAWGLLAFAHEQVGELDAAQAAGEHAVAMNPDDPWAQHAVAHVHEARGDAGAGIAWLAPRAASWDRCSSFMFTHNWWHLALFHLERGEAGAALALYDERVWGVRKGYVQDQVNAVSLLARLEQAGVDVGARWVDVAGHVRPRIFDRQSAFLDLHFGYALARAGEDSAVGQLIDGVVEHAALSATPLWREVALPALHGLVACARGQWREAAVRLGPLAGRLHRLGGSTAQQAWFERLRRRALAAERLHAHDLASLAESAA